MDDIPEQVAILLRQWELASQAQQTMSKPVDPFAKFDDHDLMMELIKRGYAVFLPMDNLERVK